MFQAKQLRVVLASALLIPWFVGRAAEAMPDEQAWELLAQYQYGQDMKPLLVIDRLVIESMKSPESRGQCAARLARLLLEPGTTLPAKQYICVQLRQVGTDAEVATLAQLLGQPETSEMARGALEVIPGEAAADALRGAVRVLKDELLIGVLHALGARRDRQSVAHIRSLVEHDQASVRHAAIGALANIASDEAAAFLVARAEAATGSAADSLTRALLHCATRLAADGQNTAAAEIFNRLSRGDRRAEVRRAALRALLDLESADPAPQIATWFAGDDSDRRAVAAGLLTRLNTDQLASLSTQMDALPDDAKLMLVEVLAARNKEHTLPLIVNMAESADERQKLAGIRLLGAVGDASAIPLLIDALAARDATGDAARQSLGRLPRDRVAPALLETLTQRPELRGLVIAVLKDLTVYEAIDPLIELAANGDPAVHAVALDGLRGIADPDKHDLPRLVNLLLRTQPGAHRDEVEKTILIVCNKLPDGADRSQLLVELIGGLGERHELACLPLLGRLGGPTALQRIDAALADPRADAREAGLRALCNWPTAHVTDRLLQVVTRSDNEQHKRWALRALVRVVSLPSERPAGETLAMLREAMQRTTQLDDRQLVVSRASAVRSMETVTWVAQFLDDPALAQTACQTLVDLAHHRELRHPNMRQFGPLLDKVARISTDAEVVERAKRYRLGL
ncbi:MAG: hypothetical protein FJ276_09125 [Planctomycetes bacterium]|nr:hypothetical protein [Planctomycetota bacterium]